MVDFKFIFDFGSPKTYLVYNLLPGIEKRTNTKAEYVPVLLGGIFKSTNNVSPIESFKTVPAKGKYDDLEKDGTNKDEGEVSHFQALATAVSGTVGLGNIAGVAVAIALGGPGATFWMIVCGLIGMSTKFVECTLGVMYRDVDNLSLIHISEPTRPY